MAYNVSAFALTTASAIETVRPRSGPSEPMGTLYSGEVWASKKSTDDLVLATHRVLQRLGLTLDEPPNVWVDDPDLDKDTPEYRAVDLQDAIQHMRKWPCAKLEYFFLPCDPTSKTK